MSERAAFDALQDRWASGEVLSAEEEKARLGYAAGDPLATRELALFAELSTRFSAPDDDGTSAAAVVARARGVRLRVVPPGETTREAARKERERGARLGGFGAGRAALVVGGLVAAAAAAAAVLVARRPTVSTALVPAQKPVAARDVPPGAVVAPPSLSALTRSELVFASGDVRVGTERAVVGGRTFGPGERIATGEGRACLSVEPGVAVCLGSESEVELGSLAAADVRVRVVRGAAAASLSPRSAGHAFSLVAGELSATAHGTVFSLEVSGRAQRVTVLEGSVAVATPGRGSELVAAHSSLALADGALPKLAVTGRAEEARVLAWLAPNKLAQGGELGVLEIGEQGGERALLDGQGPFALPLSAFVGAGRHRVALRPAKGSDRFVETDVEAGSMRRLGAADLAPPSEAAAPSARGLLEQARARLAAGDARGARELYERLRQTHPASPEAHTVLVSLGKLELESGAAERALALFDAYAKSGGSLLPEALAGRIRALRTLGQKAEERRAIAAYLASYPRSFEAPALEQRLRTLASP